MDRKIVKIISALTLWSVWSAVSPAEGITFRPDPFGDPGQTLQIVGFDPAPGSLLAVGILPALNGGGGEFDLVYQSRLADVLPGTPLPGLGTSYDILTLIHSRANGRFDAPGFASFTNPATAGPSTVELRYHNLAVPLDERTGAGFNTPADPVILSGRVVHFDGFEVLSDPSIFPLDQSATGPADVDSLDFVGVQNVRVALDLLNPDFFPDPNMGRLELVITSLTSAPFFQVPPNRGDFFDGTARNIGGVNGQDGPDIVFESDLFMTLEAPAATVPAPVSHALVLCGLGLLAAARAPRSMRRSA